MPIIKRTCWGCEEVKPIEEYPLVKATGTKRHKSCNDCYVAAQERKLKRDNKPDYRTTKVCESNPDYVYC